MPSGTSSVGSDVPTEIQNQIQTGKPSQEDFNKAIMQILQAKQMPGGAPAGQISGARVPQVSSGGVPQVAGATNPSGVPGAAVGLGQQMPQGLPTGSVGGGSSQFEFSTKQGRTASDVSKIGDTLTGILSQAQQRKQKGYENQGYLYTKLYYDAMERGDTQMANAIANDPDIHKVLSKAFGMKEGLPTMGQQPEKPQKEEKPVPEKQGAMRAMMERITGKGKQGQQQQKAPNLPMPQVTPQQQARTSMAQGMSNVLKQPGTSEQVAKIGMGLEVSPADQAKMQASMQTEITKAVAELSKAQAEIQGKMDVATKQIAGREKVAGMESASREKVAGIDAMSRIQAAMTTANASLKAGKLGDAVKDLNSVASEYLDSAKAAMSTGGGKKFDDPEVQEMFDKASKMMKQSSALASSGAFFQEDNMMNKMLPAKKK